MGEVNYYMVTITVLKLVLQFSSSYHLVPLTKQVTTMSLNLIPMQVLLISHCLHNQSDAAIFLKATAVLVNIEVKTDFMKNKEFRVANFHVTQDVNHT